MKKKKRKIKRRKQKPIRYDREDPRVKFTKRRRFIIYEALRAKLPKSRGASLAGVTEKTINVWLNMGKDKKKNPVHAEFRKRIKEIETQHEKEALEIINSAAKGGRKIIETKLVIGPKGKEFIRIKRYTPPTWQAAAWFLERRHKEEYGRDFPGRDDPSKTSPEELAMEVKKIADRLFESVPVG